MTQALTYAMPVALGAVLVVLVLGMVNLFRGGEGSRSRSNQLMRLRVLLQFLAVVVLMALVWFKTRAGG
jgi:hypothetical protein